MKRESNSAAKFKMLADSLKASRSKRLSKIYSLRVGHDIRKEQFDAVGLYIAS